MNTQTRMLMSAATIAAYALLMFTASGFFLANYRETIADCSRFDPAGCVSNEAIYVSIVSLKIGVAVFFLMGTFAWVIASYLGVRWVKLRTPITLP